MTRQVMAGSALRRAAATLLTLPLAVAGLSCSAADAAQPPRPIERTRAAATSPDDAVNMVLAISVDGLNSKTIRALGPKRTPALHRMMRQGAGTLNARTAREQTRTLPNHTGMLTGRRIDDDHGGHGVTYNSDHGSTVSKAAGHYVPSVFDVVHDHGGRTALRGQAQVPHLRPHLERPWGSGSGRPQPRYSTPSPPVQHFATTFWWC